MSQQRDDQNSIELCCFEAEVNNVKIYSGMSTAKTLWKITKINRKVEDKQEGYQRALNTSRVKAVTRFLRAGGILPTSVLISFNCGQFDHNDNTLSVPDIPDSGWIIDGQHRLAGAYELDQDVPMPFVAFVGLPIKRQIEQFITINRNQKGVPSSLYYDLLNQLPGGRKSEGDVLKERTSDIAFELRSQVESPFYQKIVTTTAPRKGQISLANFVRKVSPHLKRDGLLHNMRDDLRGKLLSNYFEALSSTFPDEAVKEDPFYFKTVGFGAFLELFPLVYQTTFSRTRGGFTVSEIKDTLEPLVSYNFEEIKGSGSGAERAVYEELRVLIEDSTEESVTVRV